ALDDIVDFAEEAADQLGLYGVEAPMEQAQEVAEVLVGCAEQVAAALRGLRNGAALAPHLVEIHRLENEADRLQRAAVAGLFANGIDPMMLIRWKDIFDTLEAAVDACESVANVLAGIVTTRPRPERTHVLQRGGRSGYAARWSISRCPPDLTRCRVPHDERARGARP